MKFVAEKCQGTHEKNDLNYCYSFQTINVNSCGACRPVTAVNIKGARYLWATLLIQSVRLSALHILFNFLHMSFSCPCVSSEIPQFRIKAVILVTTEQTAKGKKVWKRKREMTGYTNKQKSFIHISLVKEWKNANKIVSENKLFLFRSLTDWPTGCCHPQPSALPCTFNRYGSPQGRDIWSPCKSTSETL